VLLQLYRDPEVVRQVVEDASKAPIPESHRALFAWCERFVRGSWNMTERDLEPMRAVGLSDTEIVSLAGRACGQTWFVMSGDGGGVGLDGDALRGPAVGQTRDVYAGARAGLTARSVGAVDAPAPPSSDGLAWVATDESSDRFQKVAARARERYGFVPNLLRSISLRPETCRVQLLALELLEAPQSRSLDRRRHALVRARVSALNGSEYFQATSRAYVERTTGDPELADRLAGEASDVAVDAADRVVLDFATKVARNAYKLTARDAEGFRAVGLDDEAYLDVLNTTALQTGLARLGNCLGVTPDPVPLLPNTL
jgi:uncharacterized peroxidase-related enzyme